jgi:hypothetical protein
MAAGAAALPSIQDSRGVELAGDALAAKLKEKRVALYFSAGWFVALASRLPTPPTPDPVHPLTPARCPMCTGFEPALQKFRHAAEQSGKPVEFIYVGCDRSKAGQAQRATALNMMQVPFDGDARAELKKTYKVWPGAEVVQFGTGRRSGVPALVVLGANSADELAFVAAEAKGAKALGDWPLDAGEGIWK